MTTTAWNQPTPIRGLPWLRSVPDQQPPPPAELFDPARANSGGDGYARAALDAECDRVLTASNGTRNHTLNRAAFSLGQLVAGGELDRALVERELAAAARLVGLHDSEIGPTIASGLNSGAATPRTAPPPVTSAGTGADRSGTGPGQVAAETTEEDIEQTVEEWVHEHLPRLDWQALWDDDSEEEWIVEPILPARRLVALYSPPKVGKSLLLLEIAVGVARGVQVLGTTPDRPRRVLYVDFENDPKGDIRERLQAMRVKPQDLENLVYLSFPNLPALDSAQGAAQLMAAVDTYGCEVVVIDTVSRAIKGEENENDTWLNFYRHTGRAMKSKGVSMIRLDHTGKDETKGQRGGSAKSGDVDMVWRMTKVSDTVYQLDCEAHRMPVLEKVIVIHRETSPKLWHRVDGAGRSAVWRTQEAAVTKALDAAGLDARAGRDAARKVLKDAGVTVSNNILAEVLRRRKESMGIDFPTCPQDQDRGTDVRLSSRSTDRYGQVGTNDQ